MITGNSREWAQDVLGTVAIDFLVTAMDDQVMALEGGEDPTWPTEVLRNICDALKAIQILRM